MRAANFGCVGGLSNLPLTNRFKESLSDTPAADSRSDVSADYSTPANKVKRHSIILGSLEVPGNPRTGNNRRG